MSEKFVASNGVVVQEWVTAGWLQVGNPYDLMSAISEGWVVALREFFQHERDEELGRWRDPENPDVVVYRTPYGDDRDGRRIEMANERTNETQPAWENLVVIEDAEQPEGWAARYFAAHPEPKPWGSAKNNEVWALRFSDQHGFLPYAVKTDEGGPRFWWTGNEGQSAGYFAREFAEGHRIFPEVSDVAE